MKNKLLFSIGLLTLVGIALLSIGLWQSRNAQAEPDRDSAAAVQRAIEIAHARGLEVERPDGIVSKRTTLQEWFALNHFTPDPNAAPFGLDPKRSVWIVAMKGQVNWSGPGRRGGAGDQFDNITVLLDTQTLAHLGTLSVAPNEPLPLGLQR